MESTTYINPQKVVDWTIGAQNCRDLHTEFKEDACKQCPMFNLHMNQKFGGLETITASDCNMYEAVVKPLMAANAEVKEKDRISYEYFKTTGIYKYF